MDNNIIRYCEAADVWSKGSGENISSHWPSVYEDGTIVNKILEVLPEFKG